MSAGDKPESIIWLGPGLKIQLRYWATRPPIRQDSHRHPPTEKHPMSRGRKTGLVVRLTREQRALLESWQMATATHRGLARRGRIILMLADGAPISEISRAVGIRRRFVYKWAHRFLEEGPEGLYDRPGRGRSYQPLG